MSIGAPPPAGSSAGFFRRFLRANAVVVIGTAVMLATTGLVLGLTESQTAPQSPLAAHQLHSLGKGLLNLDATLAALFDTGKAPGAAIVTIASVNCGPPGATLTPGLDLECGINSSVGPANMIVTVESPGATRFAIVEIGTDLVLSNQAAVDAVRACTRGGSDICASDRSAPQYPSGSSFGGTSPSPSVAGLLPCVGGPVERPTEIVLACADGNSYVQDLRWSEWNSHAALGQGSLEENDCTPYCAAGKFYRYAATITVSDPEPTHYGLLFTRYKVTTTTPIRPTGLRSFGQTLFTQPG